MNWASPMNGPRSDFTFARALEAALLRIGRASEVRAITMTSERTNQILLTWQREVLGYSPDVIVLVYGHYETMHLFLPWWLERHANSLRARPRLLIDLYRKRLLRPTWMVLARLQARLDRWVDPTIRRGRPRKVAADLETYIGQVRQVGSPLVILFELLPPASRYRSWFPGMTRRVEVMNDAIAQVVTRVDDPDVRLFKVSALVEEHAGGDIDRATPDGFHYTPELHRHIGTALAGEIDGWARTQRHLDLGQPSDMNDALG